jgi:hypothetical protein
MAAAIIPDIWRRVQTSPAESIVLQTISYRANIQGQNARISYEALAAATDFSERWCKQIVHRLEEKHLLRVQRVWIARGKCAINRYDVIRPWLRELTYRQAFHRRASPTAPLSGERTAHPNTTQVETKEPAAPCDHETCIRVGLTEGSAAYRAARGLPPPDGEGT